MDKVRIVHYSNKVKKIRTSQLWLLPAQQYRKIGLLSGRNSISNG